MAEKQAIKLPDDEIKKIREIKQSYNSLMLQIGQAELQIHDLENAIDGIKKAKKELLENYEKSKASERQYLQELNNKYGVGELNLDTGLFTPEEKK